MLNYLNGKRWKIFIVTLKWISVQKFWLLKLVPKWKVWAFAIYVYFIIITEVIVLVSLSYIQCYENELIIY